MAGADSLRARERRITRALAAIERRFGPDLVRRLQVGTPVPAAPGVPTGSLGLDLILGTGGFPRGRLTEVLGRATSGKTRLLFGAIAAAQRQGGRVALVDALARADPQALEHCGVRIEELLVIRPDSATDALALLTILAHCTGFDLVALASLDALADYPLCGTPRGGDLPADPGRYDVARLVSRWLRVLIAGLDTTSTAVVLTNEWLPHLPGHRSSGGRALRHYAAARVLAEPLARLPEAGGRSGGLRVELTVIKSKVGSPGGRAEVELGAEGGVDGPAELLALGLATGLIARGPIGLQYGREGLGRGPDAARRSLAGDPALAARLTAAILAARDRRAA